MTKVFTELSANQTAAIGTTCRVCSAGEYRRMDGRFGPWVQCSRYECKDKVYRPRGVHASTDAAPEAPERTPAEVEIDRQITEDAAPTTTDMGVPDMATGSLEQTIISLVKPHIDSALSHVKVDASSVLADVKEQIASEIAAIRAMVPQPIVLTRPDGETAKVEGAHFMMPRILRCLNAGLFPFLWGPPGTGKSTALIQAAQALGVDFEVDTLDPTTTRSMVQGYTDARGEQVLTPFARRYLSGGLWIGEEIDLAPAAIQSLLNAALANGHAPIAGRCQPRSEKFMCAVNGNTAGMPTSAHPERKRMGEAFRDRLYFMYFPRDPAITARACGVTPEAVPERRLTMCTSAEWHTFVTKAMSWTTKNAPTLHVTDRAVHVGLRALSAGESVREVADGTIFRGADAELVAKCLSACAMPENAVQA